IVVASRTLFMIQPLFCYPIGRIVRSADVVQSQFRLQNSTVSRSRCGIIVCPCGCAAVLTGGIKTFWLPGVVMQPHFGHRCGGMRTPKRKLSANFVAVLSYVFATAKRYWWVV